MMTILTCVALWWITGILAFIYWWTYEHDLEVDDLIVGIIVGLCLGPFAIIAGWIIHKVPNFPFKPPTILVKKRAPQSKKTRLL